MTPRDPLPRDDAKALEAAEVAWRSFKRPPCGRHKLDPDLTCPDCHDIMLRASCRAYVASLSEREQQERPDGCVQGKWAATPPPSPDEKVSSGISGEGSNASVSPVPGAEPSEDCGHGSAESVLVYHTGEGNCPACRVAEYAVDRVLPQAPTPDQVREIARAAITQYQIDTGHFGNESRAVDKVVSRFTSTKGE